ncbi:MAG: hypothetical protein OXO49_00165 [Gammaproteobacteria bacterium]|nr:hypothetical protein [Gammaproteobacteria bacterium]MDE0251399.1 hypothetical protein [Gammaproteobacteria bacterium]MDE0401918.1 hypothetical protein [Gammaproteobacteria bacterium]
MLLIIAHIGLFILVLIEAVVICVLYAQVIKLGRLVHEGGLSHTLVGYDMANFQALDSRNGQTITFSQLEKRHVLLLIVNSSCSTCQQLLHELQKVKLKDWLRVRRQKLVVYCQGAVRGSVKLLSEFDGCVLTLVSQSQELTNLLPVRVVPSLLEIDKSGRVVRHQYPSAVDDVLKTLYIEKDNSETIES